jgi:hypothetical protein
MLKKMTEKFKSPVSLPKTYFSCFFAVLLLFLPPRIITKPVECNKLREVYVKISLKMVLLLLTLGLFFSCASTPAGLSGKESAAQARDRALSVRAEVAAKDDFAAAQAAFDDAAALEAAKSSEADAKYREAERSFTSVYETVKSKRDAAQRELNAAKTAISDVEKKASELQSAQGGKK